MADTLTIKDAAFEPRNQNAVIKPFVMSHGTCECRDLKRSREFYESFLGLECLRHGQTGMLIRCGMKFHVVCLEVGDNLRPATKMNHWGLDVRTKEEVDAAYQAVLAVKEKYNIGDIIAPAMHHGVYSMYFEDMNSVWWEIEYYDGVLHDDFFDLGDQYDENGQPLSAG